MAGTVCPLGVLGTAPPPPPLPPPPVYITCTVQIVDVALPLFYQANLPLEGSLVEVLIGQDGADGTAAFCVEPSFNGTQEYCPSWAGAPSPSTTYNSRAGKWVAVDIASSTSTSVTIDLKALNGTAPVAVRYSWGIFDCCNSGDPMLYVDKPCDTACPITSSTLLPANPFIAKLVGGKCSCIAPQVC